MRNLTIFSFAEYSIEHSCSAEQSDISTVQWRKRPASDVIQFRQEHTVRLTVCG